MKSKQSITFLSVSQISTSFPNSGKIGANKILLQSLVNRVRCQAEARERALAHAESAWRNHKAPLAERGRRTVHRGSMPSVRHRCSVLYVFSLYLLLSLFLSPYTHTHTHRGRRILYPRPGLVPGLSIPHRPDTRRIRSLEARVSLPMIEKGRKSPLPPPRVSLLQEKKK